MTAPNDASGAERSLFVQYLFFKVAAAWRRLPAAQREQGRKDFADALAGAPELHAYAYSTLGLKSFTQFMLWCQCASPDLAQETIAKLLLTGFGQFCEISYSLFGLTRPSIYTKRRTIQEQAVYEQTRLRYLIVYPFVKSTDWYLLSREARQGFMNEHMRVGHDFEDVRQVLLYSTGLDDQEFVVAYETDRLERQQDLVIALRATESRRSTVRDTPIFTCIHRPLHETLALNG
ncbi:MAG: chlorite dismutase family protein [Gemmatimonadaceae bacterium]